MLTCRKWRREREKILEALESKKIKVSARRDERDLRVLFGEAAVEIVLQLIESTAAGQRREAEDTQWIDGWDVALLNRDNVGGLSCTDEQGDGAKAAEMWWSEVVTGKVRTVGGR
jgi:hypothetical protein